MPIFAKAKNQKNLQGETELDDLDFFSTRARHLFVMPHEDGK
jgi:hypothetical protein